MGRKRPAPWLAAWGCLRARGRLRARALALGLITWEEYKTATNQ